MIATGTDVKPLECVFFMRGVKSRTYFEQMKGRGVRVINPTDLQQVTPDARIKDHFVIVDAVGVTETAAHGDQAPRPQADRSAGPAASRTWPSASVTPISSPPSPTGSPGSTCASARPTERCLQELADGTTHQGDHRGR